MGFIDIADIWARPGIKRGNSAVYMVIRNNDTLPDTLYNAESDIAKKVEIHMTMKHEGGRMGMHKVDYIVIPPKGELKLEPGGYHIMLINLNKPLRGGNRINLTLYFKRAGKIEITTEVK
jgi:copper(I)-binding protein